MIKLTDEIYVMSDVAQYIVGKPTTAVSKGVERVVIQKPRYYTNMSQLLRATVSQALKYGVKNETITTLREYVKETERLQDEFRRLLEPLE